MCAERLHRFLIAIMLLVSLYFNTIGSEVGLFLQLFIAAMIVIWGVTNFCPSLWLINQITTNCKTKQ